MFGGLVSKAWATGARQKGGGGKGQHRRALSSVSIPPRTAGAQVGKGSQESSLLSANQLL